MTSSFADDALGLRSESGAEAVIRTLRGHGVTTVFGYPGGAIMPIYDALPNSGLRHILCRHEQGAAFAAAGYGRMTGRAGVCLATSGPGATNLVTGIADAFMDSVPLVAITGQVSQAVMGTDAFQEIDTFGITMPVVKHSYVVRRPEDLAPTIAEAFAIAEGGRPGPVVIDIPKDVQQARAERQDAGRLPRTRVLPDDAALARAAGAIASAERPLLYIGGGVVRAGATAEVREFARRSGIPAVCTLQGLGVLPTGDPQLLGMLGMHGSRAANLAVQSCDLLVVIGARFDDRATGRLAGFAPAARVVHFDRDEAEIGKLRPADVAVPGELAEALARLDLPTLSTGPWLRRCHELSSGYGLRFDPPAGPGVFAPALLRDLSQRAGDRFVAVADVGQHQMWVAQACRFSKPQAHITSGGLGSMGFSLPTAIGCKIADPDACVVSINGDGGFMMNIQELATVRRYGIPLKILVLNNSRLGMVRQWQELFFDGNFSEVDLSDNPDFAEVARAFGIEGFTIDRRGDVDAALDRLVAAEGPILCHVRIDPSENVWPLVPPGANNHEMMEG